MTRPVTDAGPFCYIAIGLITHSNETDNVCSCTLLNPVMGPANTRLDTNAAG